MKYKLQATTFTTLGIAFEYNFETDHKAVDLASEYVRRFDTLSWVKSFMLYVKTDDEVGWKPVCKITLERPDMPRVSVKLCQKD